MTSVQGGGWPHQLRDPHVLSGAAECLQHAAGREARRGAHECTARVGQNCAHSISRAHMPTCMHMSTLKSAHTQEPTRMYP